MSNYRQIHTKIWKDAWFTELQPTEKLLFIYLFSNERASLIGLYEITIKHIAFETDLSREFVQSTLDKFAKAGKVYYESSYIYLPKMFKYNVQNIASEKIRKAIISAFELVPAIGIKAMCIEAYNASVPPAYRIYTVSIPVPQEQEQEQEQYKNRNNTEAVAAVFKSYENNISTLTPTIVDKINLLLEEYPQDWIDAAFQEAARHNKRSLAYAQGILRNRKDGKGKEQAREDKDRAAELAEYRRMKNARS